MYTCTCSDRRWQTDKHSINGNWELQKAIISNAQERDISAVPPHWFSYTQGQNSLYYRLTQHQRGARWTANSVGYQCCERVGATGVNRPGWYQSTACMHERKHACSHTNRRRRTYPERTDCCAACRTNPNSKPRAGLEHLHRPADSL